MCSKNGFLIVTVVNRYGLAIRACMDSDFNQATVILETGNWQERSSREIASHAPSGVARCTVPPLRLHAFTHEELAELFRESGFVVDSFFASGIVSALLHNLRDTRDILSHLRREMFYVESQLSQMLPALSISMEIGAIAIKV